VTAPEINLKDPTKWIKDKDKPKLKGKTIRLTIDITPELHQKLKMKCAVDRCTIAEVVRGLLEEKVRDQPT
jgi:hypothetical protein